MIKKYALTFLLAVISCLATKAIQYEMKNEKEAIKIDIAEKKLEIQKRETYKPC